MGITDWMAIGAFLSAFDNRDLTRIGDLLEQSSRNRLRFTKRIR
jgi:hypothetical protein